MRAARLVMLAACAAVVVSAVPALADGVGLDIEGRAWRVEDFTGSARATGATLGTEFDLVGNMGLGERRDLPGLRLGLQTSRYSVIRLDASRLRLNGTRTRNGDVVFDDRVFPSGSTVRTSLEQDYLKLDWVIQFIRLGNGAFRLGPIVGVHGWWADLTLRNTSAGFERTRTFNDAVPALGLAMNVRPWHPFDFFVEASGMDQGASGHHLDAEGGLRFVIANRIGVVGGYRHLEIVNRDRRGGYTFARWTARGPFAGVTLRF